MDSRSSLIPLGMNKIMIIKITGPSKQTTKNDLFLSIISVHIRPSCHVNNLLTSSPPPL